MARADEPGFAKAAEDARECQSCEPGAFSFILCSSVSSEFAIHVEVKDIY